MGNGAVELGQGLIPDQQDSRPVGGEILSNRDYLPLAIRPIPKQLIKKLCLIMGECGSIPKKGWNKYHEYEYIRETDVVERLQALFAKHNIFIFTKSLSEHTEGGFGRQRDSFQCRVEIEYTIADGDSGEYWVTTVFGYGQDTGEKGYYKALAGAHKYFLMKHFQIAADDDPENERKNVKDERKEEYQRKQEEKKQPTRQPPKNQQPPAKPKEQKKDEKTEGGLMMSALTALYTLATNKRVGHDKVKEFIVDKFKLDTSKKLKQEQYDIVMEWLKKKPEPPKVGSDDDIKAAAKETSSNFSHESPH